MKDTSASKGALGYLAATGRDTKLDIPGGKRTDFPDGSYLYEGPNGERFIVSESGNINANMPVIRRIQIHDLSQVVRHDITQTRDTVAHTIHFMGGGLFSYLHLRDGRGMSVNGRQIDCRLLADGVILVLGTLRGQAR